MVIKFHDLAIDYTKLLMPSFPPHRDNIDDDDEDSSHSFSHSCALSARSNCCLREFPFVRLFFFCRWHIHEQTRLCVCLLLCYATDRERCDHKEVVKGHWPIQLFVGKKGAAQSWLQKSVHRELCDDVHEPQSERFKKEHVKSVPKGMKIASRKFIQVASTLIKTIIATHRAARQQQQRQRHVVRKKNNKIVIFQGQSLRKKRRKKSLYEKNCWVERVSLINYSYNLTNGAIPFMCHTTNMTDKTVETWSAYITSFAKKK